MVIELKNVSAVYTNSNQATLKAIEDISFAIDEGEIVCIVGPSGCGKTTLLSLISGLKKSSSGEIFHRGKLVLEPSNQRVIIFQNHILFPWMTSIQNIEFALKSRGVSNAKIKTEAYKFLKMVKLEKYADNYPHELSGGMQQRIGIARALSCNPDVLLFDEPFASLDQITKSSVYREILQISKRTKKTMVFVTHNIEEAIYLGDKIIVLSGCPGKVIKKINVKFEKLDSLAKTRLLPKFTEIENSIINILS